MAGGDFERIFQDMEIPALPAAVSQLVIEVGREEPDFQKIGQMIATLPDIAVKVLTTVNSAYYSLPNPVNSVMHAVTVLGLNNIRPLILSFAMKSSLPIPPNNLFNQDAFWSDSLIKSLFARAFADRHCREDRDEAFTAMLLADIALPILLIGWGEYYQSVIKNWQQSATRLSQLERKSFRWDHAQAGAWILKHWAFPVELVCFVGLHNTDAEQLKELELYDTIALPVAVASNTPSVLQPNLDRANIMIGSAMKHFGYNQDEMLNVINSAQEGFQEISKLFELSSSSGDTVFEILEQLLVTENEKAG